MPRGRPAKAPTRSLNIRVDVEDLDMLALIQTATRVPTAEVVRTFLKQYIEQNRDTLRVMGEHLKRGHHWHSAAGPLEDDEVRQLYGEEEDEGESSRFFAGHLSDEDKDED